MTGVRHALSEGVEERTAIAEAVIECVRTSVPDTLAALKPERSHLFNMAEAKLEE